MAEWRGTDFTRCQSGSNSKGHREMTGMKKAPLARWLLFVACGAPAAFAGPCTGAEAQLALVSKKITLDAADAAQGILGALVASYPECPEILLAQARIQDSRGNAQEAADLYVRYTDLEPDNSSGFAYFGRFFLEQRDYM